MLTSLFILLQDTGGEATAPSGLFGGSQGFLFMGLILLVMYFFMIRPQQKRAKEERTFREGLAKGDKVMSIGGIYGQVETIDETSVLVRVDSNTKMRFDKSALKAAPTPAEKKEK
ncbi:MAG: preprotein translocase subunit YajC [Bacteroidota bacterium]